MSLENSTRERALWIRYYMWRILEESPETSKRAAKKAAQEALASLLDARKAQARLLSRLERREKELEKPVVGTPVHGICKPRSRASSVSSHVLYQQARDAQGKGRRIPAKRTESLSPSVKIRKHNVS